MQAWNVTSDLSSESEYDRRSRRGGEVNQPSQVTRSFSRHVRGRGPPQSFIVTELSKRNLIRLVSLLKPAGEGQSPHSVRQRNQRDAASKSGSIPIHALSRPQREAWNSSPNVI